MLKYIKEHVLTEDYFRRLEVIQLIIPERVQCWHLYFALKLDIKAARDLLARAEYALSPSNKGDLIIKYFIEHQVYDLMALNFTLEEYGQPILGE